MSGWGRQIPLSCNKINQTHGFFALSNCVCETAARARSCESVPENYECVVRRRLGARCGERERGPGVCLYLHHHKRPSRGPAARPRLSFESGATRFCVQKLLGVLTLTQHGQVSHCHCPNRAKQATDRHTLQRSLWGTVTKRPCFQGCWLSAEWGLSEVKGKKRPAST